jgi:hypothetical protein
MAELQKVTPPQTMARTNSEGLIEIVCLHTGRVLCVQSSLKDLLNTRMEDLVRFETPEGPVYLERGIGPAYLRRMNQKRFSAIHADLICEKITQGRTLLKACEDLNLDYATICRWKREHPAFANSLEDAKRDRAEAFHDEAIDTSIGSFDPKLKVETLKWAAEKGNAEKFGNKTKIVGDPNAPLSFIIDTGIRRPGDPGYVAPPEETPAIEIEKPAEKKGEYDVE